VRAKIAELDPESSRNRNSPWNPSSFFGRAARLIMQFVGVFAGFALLSPHRHLRSDGLFRLLPPPGNGIRMSLGAEPGDIVKNGCRAGNASRAHRYCVRRALRWGLTRFIATLLFGVHSTDPIAFTAAA